MNDNNAKLIFTAIIYAAIILGVVLVCGMALNYGDCSRACNEHYQICREPVPPFNYLNESEYVIGPLPGGLNGSDW